MSVPHQVLSHLYSPSKLEGVGGVCLIRLVVGSFSARRWVGSLCPAPCPEKLAILYNLVFYLQDSGIMIIFAR